MKTRKLFALLAALTVAAVSATSVYADTTYGVDIDETNISGSTTVKADINGTAGSVAYTIEIPEAIDFGTLENTDTITSQNFVVTLTEWEETGNTSYTGVSVYFKNSTATKENTELTLTTSDNSAGLVLDYDIYTAGGASQLNNTALRDVYFFLDTFTPSDVTTTPQGGTTYQAQLDQYQIGEFLADNSATIDDIAGHYEGLLTFYSMLSTS